jgi:hypothetical protein
VDWRKIDRAAAKTGDVDLISQLKIVSAIRASRRVDTPRPSSRWTRTVEAAVAVVLSIAVAQLLLAIMGTPSALARVPWPYIVNVLSFGVGGVVLLAGGGRDRRVPLLGGLFLTISSAFAVSLMPQPGVAFGGALTALLRPLQPEAFLPLMSWRFVREFPVDSQRPRVRRIADAFVGVSFGIGAVLFVINAVGYFGDSKLPGWLAALFDVFDRNHPEGVYWPLLCVVAAPALLFLLWRTRLETYEARRRVTLFVGALGVGLTPFLLAVVATPFVPVLRDPLVHQRVGVVLYGALMSIVPSVTYCVLVERVMELQFVIRVTLQYALARYAVWAVSLGPLAYVALDIHANQQSTIAEYFQGFRLMGPLALSAAGLIVLSSRQHLLRAIDRWFLRESPDQSEILARLAQRFRTANSFRGVASALAEELGRALRPTSLAILLVNDDGSELIPIEGETAGIPGDSVLAEILRSARSEIQLDSRALEALARVLPSPDRKWLDDADVRLLFPLVGASGMFLGVLVIGRPRTGLPYSTAHRALMTATSGQAAMQIENRRLRDSETGQSRPHGNAGARGLDWQNEPATHCPRCRRVWSCRTRRCSCGAATVSAALPLRIQGKFRLDRLIGVGGTGVVYRAFDAILDRQVAIKTLPSLRPESARRLQREARAMANVVHPNLALIYGTEQWRGTLMLVVEYLAGGTLRERMSRGAMECEEAIELGIVLSDVLDRLHGSGMLHRDVKPSNIGVTGDGRPKLMDFGLALLHRIGDLGRPAGSPPDCVSEAPNGSADPAVTVTGADGLAGTPLYLAPEALAGCAPRSSFDLWALALVLYEAIAGRHPFAGGDRSAVLAAVERADVPDVREYRPTCPPGLAVFLRDALSRDIARRPASAAALRHELQLHHAVIDRAAAVRGATAAARECRTSATRETSFPG